MYKGVRVWVKIQGYLKNYEFSEKLLISSYTLIPLRWIY